VPVIVYVPYDKVAKYSFIPSRASMACLLNLKQLPKPQASRSKSVPCHWNPCIVPLPNIKKYLSPCLGIQRSLGGISGFWLCIVLQPHAF